MFFFENIPSYSGFTLIILNIVVYIVLSIALFVMLLVLNDKSYSTLNKLKNLNEFYFLFMSTLLLLLSLAGVPPLFGFVGKFILYIQLLSTKSFYLFTVFLIFNVFILYFYIQNIRFMVTKNINKTRNSMFFYNNNHELVITFLLFILFFNVFGIFYFENFFIYISY